MRIWIDLANAPHVNFFVPIINRLSSSHEVILTIRDFNQTAELAAINGLKGFLLGSHGGRAISAKLIATLQRVALLRDFVKGRDFDIAVSHNSYSHIVAARTLGITTVTAMDYEGQPANHLAFRLADRILVPECFPTKCLKKFGAANAKVRRYAGLKEQVYLSDFKPDESFESQLIQVCGLVSSWRLNDTVLVTVRPPALSATYHRFDNPLFHKILSLLDGSLGITTIVLPRTKIEGSEFRKQYTNIAIANGPLDGRNLVYYSDLVISAGGTMNREAAILGTPAYTAFAGELPAVDRFLMDHGRLVSLRSESDLAKIALAKKEANHMKAMSNPTICDEIISAILQ